jgi:acetylornithine deacetylase/succinyl-diaminopimelate desuccinylase-like protein
VERRAVEHIRAQGFAVIESPDVSLPDELRGRAVQVVERHGYDPAKTPADLPISRRVVEIVERATTGRRRSWCRRRGAACRSGPFTDLLGLPTIVVPYANANNRQHSPNEHLRLDHLYQGIRTTARLLVELGE